MFDFPNNPTVGQVVVGANGASYQWDGAKWYAISSGAGAGPGVASFNARSGAVVLSSADVAGALTFTPYDAANPAGYQTAAQVAAAVPIASSTTPAMDGTAAIGVGTTFARADHVHPVDTSRYAASNPAGYQTAAQVAAAVPIASFTTPVMDGAAAVGTGTTWARADHQHPSDTSSLALSGGTMTGPLTLAADPAAALQAASKQYVDAVAFNLNLLNNGDMKIDQRNGGASGTGVSVNTVDRWFFNGIAGKFTWGRNLNAAAGPPGFPYYFGFLSSSAYAAAAGDVFHFNQRLEGDAISGLMWGTVSAQPVTLSFWVYSNQTGTFSGAVRNYAGTRSYPFTFAILVANTWTKIVVTIPGDTAGTWVSSGSAGALIVGFDLGSGSTYRGPANAWGATAYFGATGAVSVVAVIAATLYVTGVKLEMGSVVTPFDRLSPAKALIDCQRYYQAGSVYYLGYQIAGQSVGLFYTFPTTMRATPTMTLANSSGSNAGTAGSSAYVNGVQIYHAATASTVTWFIDIFTASAEL